MVMITRPSVRRRPSADSGQCPSLPDAAWPGWYRSGGANSAELFDGKLVSIRRKNSEAVVRGFPGGWGGGTIGPTCRSPSQSHLFMRGLRVSARSCDLSQTQKHQTIRCPETAFVTGKRELRPTATEGKKQRSPPPCRVSCQLGRVLPFVQHLGDLGVPSLRSRRIFFPTASRSEDEGKSPPHATNARYPQPASRIRLTWPAGSQAAGHRGVPGVMYRLQLQARGLVRFSATRTWRRGPTANTVALRGGGIPPVRAGVRPQYVRYRPDGDGRLSCRPGASLTGRRSHFPFQVCDRIFR